jgi:O-antigen/teichoic acid export membrane protein
VEGIVSTDFPAPSPPLAPSGWSAEGRWLLSWTGRFAGFAFVQCWVQLFTSTAGLIVVWTLSKDQYALYAITNSVQSAVSLLADLGIGIGVRSIGGRVWQDRERFGQLLNSALGLRYKFAVIALGSCVPFAAWMLRDNGADWPNTVLLCVVIMAGALPELKSNILQFVPGLYGEYGRLQKLNLGNAALRVAGVGLLALSHMNAWLVTSVGAALNWRTMYRLRRWAPEHANLAAATNPDDQRALWQLSVRKLPNTLFYCFQGQITLMILTLVGNPTGIADVTALGRLSALLTVFSTSFSGLFVPRFARCQEPDRLARLYLGLVGAMALTIAPIVLAGWFLPGPLLWVLGAKYTGLNRECGWVVSTACVWVIVAALNELNGARSWIQIGTVLYIPLTIVVQVFALTRLDVSRLDGVVMFGFLTALAALPPLIADACLGLHRRNR